MKLEFIKKLLKEEKELILRGWLGGVVSMVIFIKFLMVLITGNATEDIIYMFMLWLVVTIFHDLDVIGDFFNNI